jgi:hypothetical protein
MPSRSRFRRSLFQGLASGVNVHRERQAATQRGAEPSNALRSTTPPRSETIYNPLCECSSISPFPTNHLIPL